MAGWQPWYTQVIVKIYTHLPIQDAISGKNHII
jgi:hypothetical protein